MNDYKDCPNYVKYPPLAQKVGAMEKRQGEDRKYSVETREQVSGVNRTLAKWGGIVVGVIIVLRFIPLIPMLEKLLGTGG